MDEMTNDWKLYKEGIDYNHSLSPDYYATINRNIRVFNNQHFDGVNLKGLRPFIMPISQRAIKHLTSATVTSTVRAQYTVENIDEMTEDQGERELLNLSEYLMSNHKDRWERLKMDSLIRRILKDAALTGDMATHTYWDASYDTGQTYGMTEITDDFGNDYMEPVPIMGEFITEAVDGCNVFFGNPNDPRVNVNGKPYQPYIIIAGREVVSKLRKEAKYYKKENKMSEKDIENLILPDKEYEEQAGDRGKNELENSNSEYGKATYIIKYWEENGRIYFNKSVRGCYIRKDVDTELSIYPVAWANWDTIKNSYHGQAVMTGLVGNQLEIDKTFARLFKYLADMSIPKILVNKQYLPNGITNKVGEVILYDGALDNVQPNNIISMTQPGQIANHFLDILTLAMEQTLNLLGVSDAFLGSAKPENTSALIQQSKNSAIPLNDVQANLYQLVEDNEYIWLEFMLKKYKIPRSIAIDVEGQRKMAEFDPAKATKAKFRIKVDVGAGSLWDEGAIAQTMTNLFSAGITNAVQTLKRFPDNGMIPERDALIRELEAKQKQIEMMQTEEYKAQVVNEFMGKVKEKIENPPVQ